MPLTIQEVITKAGLRNTKHAGRRCSGILRSAGVDTVDWNGKQYLWPNAAVGVLLQRKVTDLTTANERTLSRLHEVGQVRARLEALITELGGVP